MAVGVWEPGGGQDEQRAVSSALLQQFLGLANRIEDTVTAEAIDDAGVADETWVMTAEASSWDALSSLSSEELSALARLFTIVEQQISGWDAGKKSPVIIIVKLLKQRDEFPAELRKWIKAHTDNRYLPYGSAL